MGQLVKTGGLRMVEDGINTWMISNGERWNCNHGRKNQ